MCASTCYRGECEYYIISIPQDSLSVICKIARNLKNICPEGKYPALARRRSASQLSVRSFPQFTTRNADTATLHCPATPSPYPPPHSDRTGEPGDIHLYRTPSFNFILHVHLTCPLSSFSETNMQTVMVSRGTGILADLAQPFIWQFLPIYSLLFHSSLGDLISSPRSPCGCMP